MSSTQGKVPTTVAVVGARGFSGLELLRLLRRHPLVGRLVACRHQSDFDPANELSPRGHGHSIDVISAHAPEVLIQHLPQSSSVFLATPAEASALWAPQLLAAGHTVYDLSGAFRLKPSTWGSAASSDLGTYHETVAKWYGSELASRLTHEPDQPYSGFRLTELAHYGLQPFAGPRTTATGAKTQIPLTAVPGCYATSILIPTVPLLRSGLIEPDTIAIDAKSGTTGAGRKNEPHLMAASTHASLLPYKVGRHQHLPEISQALGLLAGVFVQPSLVTHLADFRRGIQTTLFARPARGLRQQTSESLEQMILKSWSESFTEYPLVEFAGSREPNREALLNLRRVVGTARCHLTVTVADGWIYITSAIDNLLKGAASQAIENFNVDNGLATHATLLEQEALI